MIQEDRYKKRTVAVDFQPNEMFTQSIDKFFYKLVLLTNGQLKGTLNEESFILSAPSVLCLAADDILIITENNKAAAQSFAFKADFFNARALLELDINTNLTVNKQIDLTLFTTLNTHEKLIALPKKLYPKIFQWFCIIGTEVFAQSDSLWVCRIKQHLIQMIAILETLARNKEETPVDLALDYIHTHYFETITLDGLAKQAHINRVTLNKLFQAQCDLTAIAYLIDYRLKIATDLLLHTGMRVSEIAEATGFQYDTYFMKKFTKKQGMTPTKYRNTTRLIAVDI